MSQLILMIRSVLLDIYASLMRTWDHDEQAIHELQVQV